MCGIVQNKLSEADLKNLCHNEQLTTLNRFHEVEKVMKERKTKSKLQVFCSSMFDIPFEKYDVIYFDPPYDNTLGYNRQPFSQIMFKTLLNVLVNSGKNVFVSEYKEPAPEFTEVASFHKSMSLEANKSKAVVEKVFYGGTKSKYEELPGITQQPLVNTGSDTPVHDDTDDGAEPAVSIGVDTPAGGFQATPDADAKVQEAIDNLHDAGRL
jgi:16S rRNA G966 N2-methylase RsmD